MAKDVLIYVDNNIGADSNDGTKSSPLATADEAFRRLPDYWLGRAEIVFAVTHRDYEITTDAVYFGTPIGTEASPLVIRGGYEDLLVIRATRGSGDSVFTTTEIPEDKLVGAVLVRLSGTGSPVGTAISIRGNREVRPVPEPPPTWEILLQRSIGPVNANDIFKVQRPAVRLVPTETLTLTSHDGGRSLNATLIGLEFAPKPGVGLALINLRAQCDTCEFSFQSGAGFVHTNARIIGGIEDESLSPGIRCQRSQAGVYIHSSDAADIFSVTRNGILSGHVTFRTIIVRVSQGGVFIPQSLEALAAPIQILTGGAAMGQPSWGTATNKARIRNVVGTDGLRVFNGGALNSPLAPIHLDIFGCGRDGVCLDMGSTASFGPAGGDAGLITSGTKNVRFGMNIRNASRALVGRDAATAAFVPGGPAKPLAGDVEQAALDDGSVAADRFAWSVVTPTTPKSNAGMSLVRINR
jgi:hypothetical protein